jgi:histone H3/H4
MDSQTKRTRGKTEGVVARSKLREILRNKIPAENREETSVSSDAVEELHQYINNLVEEICDEAVINANYKVIKHIDIQRGISKHDKDAVKHALNELDSCMVGLTQLKIRLTGEMDNRSEPIINIGGVGNA